MNAVSSTVTEILSNIFTSASKLVFLMIAVTICVGFFSNKLTQDNFMYIATSVFSYYFGVAQGMASTSGRPPAQPPRDPNAQPPDAAPGT